MFISPNPLDPSKPDPKELENDCESEKPLLDVAVDAVVDVVVDVVVTVMAELGALDIYLLRRHFPSASL